jgi:DNA-binding SARP family transcriptional activator/tetratricopeptide (TPR) repeat protein
MPEFGVLGPVRAANGTAIAVLPPKERIVLATLLLRAGQAASVSTLIEALWDDEPPVTARNGVQGHVKQLRRLLGPAGGRIITRTPGYLIEVRPGELDLDSFIRLTGSARSAAKAGAWEGAVTLLNEALGLWRGEPLSDIPSLLLQRNETPRLAELRAQALDARIDAELRSGKHDAVTAELRHLVAAHPHRERSWAQLMLALYLGGRPSEAVAVYRQARTVLREDLGIDPGSELQDLHHRILTADSALIEDMTGSRIAPEPAAAPLPVPRQLPADLRLSAVTHYSAATLAWAAGLPAPRQLPAATAHFVGRGAELETLTALLSAAAATAPVAAISGPPGVGKTTLALRWAHQAADQFPDGQLYVNLRGFDASGKPVTALAAIRGFLDALQVPAERIPAGLPAQAALYRTLLAGRRILVVLDNARDAAQVRPLLPGTAGCLTVVTSRSRLPGLIATEGARPVSLKPLSRGEAADLLARGIGAERVADDEEAADEIIERCARLPLAVSVAAARAAIRPGVPLAALAAELQDAKTRLDLLDTRDAVSSVRSVYSWSCEQLSPPAARMFRLLGLHPGPDISLPAAASIAGLALPEARSVLEELVLSSLLTEDRLGRYSFHDLLHLYAAEQAAVHEGAEGCRSVVRRLLDHYLISAHRAAMILGRHRELVSLPAAGPDVTPAPMARHDEALTWCRIEYSALLAAMTLADACRFDVHAWQLAWCLAGFLSGQARPHEWRSVALLALAAAGRANDGYGQAQALHSLGDACTTMGRYDDARPHYAAALGMYDKLGDHLGQARVHLDLGLSYEFRERHHDVFGAISARPRQERDAHAHDALTHARRALDQFRAAGHHAGEAAASSAVGRSLALRGLAEEAVGHCERGVQMSRDLGDDRTEAIALISLGYALHKAGRYADAASACQRAVCLAQKSSILRVEAIALTHLAESHRSIGNIPAARTAWERALVILDDLRLPDADQVRARLADHATR